MNQYIEDKYAQTERVHIVEGLRMFCGMDKIHYSFLKNHSAWSHIAGKLIDPLRINASPKSKVLEQVLSLTNYFYRILLTDIFGMVTKTEETF